MPPAISRLPEAAKGHEEALSYLRRAVPPNPRHLAQSLQNLGAETGRRRRRRRRRRREREREKERPTHLGSMAEAEVECAHVAHRLTHQRVPPTQPELPDLNAPRLQLHGRLELPCVLFT